MGCGVSKSGPRQEKTAEVHEKQRAGFTSGDLSSSEVSAEPDRKYPPVARPLTQEERLELLRSLGELKRASKDPRFDSITRLLCTVFGVPAAFVCLAITDKCPSQVERRAPASLNGGGQNGSKFDEWPLLEEHEVVLVVPDTQEHEELRSSPLVQREPFLRFYASCPLVSAGGERQHYGFLRLLDVKPHADFGTEQLNMLQQFADLVIKELEKDKASLSAAPPGQRASLDLADSIQPPQLPPELQLPPEAQRQQPPRSAGEGAARPPTPTGPQDASLPGWLDPLQAAVQQHIRRRSSIPPESQASSRPGSPPSSAPVNPGGILHWAQQYQGLEREQEVQQQAQGLGGRADSQRNSRRSGAAANGTSWDGGGGPLGVLKEAEQEQLLGAVDAFREGAALLDAGTASWQMLYTNAAFQMVSGRRGGRLGRCCYVCWVGSIESGATSATVGVPVLVGCETLSMMDREIRLHGLPQDEATGQGFWDLFYVQGVAPEDFAASLAARQPFTVQVTLQSIYTTTPKMLMVDFRPANIEGQQPAVAVAATQPGFATTLNSNTSASNYSQSQTGAHSQPPDPAPTAAPSNEAASAAASTSSTSRAPAQSALPVGAAVPASSASADSGFGEALGPVVATPANFYFAILRPNSRRPQGGGGGSGRGSGRGSGGSVGAAVAGGRPLAEMSFGSSLSGGGGPFSDAVTEATASLATAGSGMWDILQGGAAAGGPAAAAARLQRQQHLASLRQAMPSTFVDVKLGPLIGRGAYGRVYRGGWNGNIVAVKVVEYQEEVDEAGNPVGTVAHARNAIFEGVLSSSLSHPNVVHTYQYAVRRLQVDGSGPASPQFSPTPTPPPPALPRTQPARQQQQHQQQRAAEERLSWEEAAGYSPGSSPTSGSASHQGTPPQHGEQWQDIGQAQHAQQQRAASPPGHQSSPPAGPSPTLSPGTSWLLSDMAARQGETEGAGRLINAEVWLIQEYCNRGPLLTAVERGAFLQPAALAGQGAGGPQQAQQQQQPNLVAVLQTLQEIAAALQYLHEHNVVHGDLTGGNVLLTTSDKDARGFTAKVVDFGLSRVCTEQYLRTRTLGCAEYMPPELITDGLLTRAADAYAFGVLAWEIYCGRRAWEGHKPAEVLRKVANRARLAFPPHTPARLRVLAEQCMAYDPATRPSFTDVVSELNSVLADTLGILHRFLAASTLAAAAAAELQQVQQQAQQQQAQQQQAQQPVEAQQAQRQEQQ
ncbi:hypothetical protein N2152v2_001795 [Parachlorella kessleri]